MSAYSSEAHNDDVGHWTLDFGQLSELHNTLRHDHGRATDAHFIYSSRRAFHFQANAARTLDEVALFNHKLVNAINRFDASRIVMNQITTQRPGRAARRRILTDVLADKEACMRPSFANFECFAR